VKDRFGVARCCCENFCEDCCNGNAPSEWDVEILLADSACQTCDEEAGGVFTLSRISDIICRWSFERKEPSWQPECVIGYAAYGDYIYDQSVTLEVRCVTETQYRITATINLNRQYASSQEKRKNPFTQQDYWVDTYRGIYGDQHVYEGFVNFNDFICDEQIDYVLNHERSSYLRQWFYNPTSPPFGPDPFTAFNIFNLTDTPPHGERYEALPNAYWRPICEPPATIKITGVP